jgi:SSS family solute:Na+ symporter/sodium/proline symporter
VLGVIAILFTYTAITSYQFIGGGDILHLVFPALSSMQGRGIIAGFVILFTAIAGMSSVAYMDVAIGLLATFSLCLALPVLVHSFSFANRTGWSAIHAALPATHFKILGNLSFAQALELFVPTCLLMLGNQSMYQKFFSAKSEKDATRAVAGWIVGTVVLETVIVALAVAGSAVFPTGEVHDHPREILATIGLHGFTPAPTFATIASGTGTVTIITTTEVLPAYALHVGQLLGALLVGAIFAKVISTANNYLFSPAANLVNDIFVRYLRPRAPNTQILLVSRAMVVLLGLWALFQSLGTESVLKKSLYAYTIYSAALTPVILAAFYWKRATAPAAVASIFTGTVVTITWQATFIHTHLPAALANRDAIFPALAASLLCLIAVSLCTPPPDATHLHAFAEN